MLLMFECAAASKSIAQFFGLVDDMEETQIQRLLECELRAGLDTLKQARISSSEQQYLLREARSNLNKAVHLEKGLNKVIALLGLALCHHLLGDQNNSQCALKELIMVGRNDLWRQNLDGAQEEWATAGYEAGRTARILFEKLRGNDRKKEMELMKKKTEEIQKAVCILLNKPLPDCIRFNPNEG